MKIAVAQINSNDDSDRNLQIITKLVAEAASAHAGLVVFPENSLFFRIGSTQSVRPLDLFAQQNADFVQLQTLKDLARDLKIDIHLTTPVKDQTGDVYNGSVLIRRNGSAELLYRKIHLFDITLEGQKPIRESDNFKAGVEPNVFEIDGIKFGSTICYDIRFSELFHHYALAEVDVILVPSAFLVKTGQAHWDSLLRARAIESQCYVLASAQVGEHTSKTETDKRQTYGHAMAIDPWGHVEQVCKDTTGLIYCVIAKDKIEKVRLQIPMKNHRRLNR